MLSRVAENLYWISRYVERAGSLARLLDDAFSMELEIGTQAPGTGPLDSVLLMLNSQAAFAKLRDPIGVAPDVGYSRPVGENREAVVRFLMFHRGTGVSILETIAQARENARSTQETVSGEAWSQLNKLHLFLNSPRAEDRFTASPSRFLDRVRRECILFQALVDGTLPRAEAYHFLQLGRYLERVDMLTRIINVHCLAEQQLGPVLLGDGGEPSFSAAPWASLLRSTSSYEAYLKQACERIDPVNVIRYLLLEDDFPRSMRFSVARCLDSLRAIDGGSGQGTFTERHLGQLDSELRYMDVEDVFRRGIQTFLLSVQDTCTAVGRDVHLAYFRT